MQWRNSVIRLGSINRLTVGEVLLAAEVLPVGVLRPGADDFFVTYVAQVLEQLQTHHQADGLIRAAHSGCVQATKLSPQCLSVNLAGQHAQRVALVYQVDQLLAE